MDGWTNGPDDVILRVAVGLTRLYVFDVCSFSSFSVIFFSWQIVQETKSLKRNVRISHYAL